MCNYFKLKSFCSVYLPVQKSDTYSATESWFVNLHQATAVKYLVDDEYQNAIEDRENIALERARGIAYVSHPLPTDMHHSTIHIKCTRMSCPRKQIKQPAWPSLADR